MATQYTKDSDTSAIKAITNFSTTGGDTFDKDFWENNQNLGSITQDAIKTITGEQILLIKNNQSFWKNKYLWNLDETAVKAIKDTQIAAIDDKDFTAFAKNPNLANLSQNAVKAITGAQIKEIQSKDFKAFATNLGANLAHLSEDAVAEITADQIAAITDFAAFATRLKANLVHLSKTAVAGIRADQIAAITDLNVFTTNLGANFVHLSPEAFKAITDAQIKVIKTEDFKAFAKNLGENLANLSPTAVKAIKDTQIKEIEPKDFNAFAKNPNLANLSSDAVAAITGAQIAAIVDAAEFKAFATNLGKNLAHLSPDAVKAITDTQIKEIALSDFTAFAKNPNLANLIPAAVEKITDSQIKEIALSDFKAFAATNLGANLAHLSEDAVKAITDAQIKVIKPEDFKAFATNLGANLAHLSPEAFKAITGAQIAKITDQDFVVFVTKNLGGTLQLTPDAVAGITGAQIQTLLSSGVNKLATELGENVKYLNAQAVKKITPGFIIELGENFNNFAKNKNLAELSKEAFNAISPDQIKRISDSALAAFVKNPHFKSLTPAGCSAIQSEQITALPTAALKNLLAHPEFVSGSTNQQKEAIIKNILKNYGFKPESVIIDKNGKCEIKPSDKVLGQYLVSIGIEGVRGVVVGAESTSFQIKDNLSLIIKHYTNTTSDLIETIKTTSSNQSHIDAIHNKRDNKNLNFDLRQPKTWRPQTYLPFVFDTAFRGTMLTVGLGGAVPWGLSKIAKGAASIQKTWIGRVPFVGHTLSFVANASAKIANLFYGNTTESYKENQKLIAGVNERSRAVMAYQDKKSLGWSVNVINAVVSSFIAIPTAIIKGTTNGVGGIISGAGDLIDKTCKKVPGFNILSSGVAHLLKKAGSVIRSVGDVVDTEVQFIRSTKNSFISTSDSARLIGGSIGSALSKTKPKSDWDITNAEDVFKKIQNPQFIEWNSGRYCVTKKSAAQSIHNADSPFHIVEVFGWDKAGIPGTKIMYLNADEKLLSQKEVEEFAGKDGSSPINFDEKLFPVVNQANSIGISISDFMQILENNKSNEIKEKITGNADETATKKTYALGISKYTAEIDIDGKISFYKGVGNEREQIIKSENSVDGQLLVVLNDLLNGKIIAQERPSTSIKGAAAHRFDTSVSQVKEVGS